MTRPEFAQQVGVSEGTIKRLEQIGVWHAAVPNPDGGREHRTLYTVEQVGEFKKMRAGLVVTTPSLHRIYSAEEAKVGFQALRDGSSVEDIVIEHGIHPDSVCAIRDRFRELRAEGDGGIYVTARGLEALEDLPLSGVKPSNEMELLDLIAAAARENACTGCKEKTPTVCAACATAREAKAKREGQLMVKRVREAAIAELKRRPVQSRSRVRAGAVRSPATDANVRATEEVEAEDPSASRDR